MELNELKEKMVGNKLFLRSCGFCNYDCGYTIIDGKIYYDVGCGCTYGGPKLNPAKEEDLMIFVDLSDEEIESRLTPFTATISSIVKCCVKCNLQLRESDEGNQFACTNESCERFGLLTVVWR